MLLNSSYKLDSVLLVALFNSATFYSSIIDVWLQNPTKKLL